MHNQVIKDNRLERTRTASPSRFQAACATTNRELDGSNMEALERMPTHSLTVSSAYGCSFARLLYILSSNLQGIWWVLVLWFWLRKILGHLAFSVPGRLLLIVCIIRGRAAHTAVSSSSQKQPEPSTSSQPQQQPEQATHPILTAHSTEVWTVNIR